MENIAFTHYWVSGFGWEETIFLPSDFAETEELGRNDKDGIIFLATNDKGGKHIFKGYYYKAKM